MRLTKEQTLALENKKLKHIIVDMLFAMRKIGSQYPLTQSMIRDALKKILEEYQPSK